MATGYLQWLKSATASSAILTQAAAGNGCVFATWPVNDGRLVGFFVVSGQGGQAVRFKYPTDPGTQQNQGTGQFGQAPASVANGSVYSGSDDHSVYKFGLP
jgi:hypothetical protein